EQGLAIAQRIGAPSSEVVQRLRLSYAYFNSAAWDEALHSSVEAIATARRVGQPRDLAFSLASMAMIAALEGNPTEAEVRIDEARTVFANPTSIEGYVSGVVNLAEAVLALHLGQVERALSIARGFDSVSTSSGSRVGLIPPYLPQGLSLLAEVQVAAGDAESALDTVRNLASIGSTDTAYFAALASRVEGLARKSLGQIQAASACLDRARKIFTALEMPFEAARCMIEQAGLASATQPELAVRYAQQSLAIFERLGAERQAERARLLLQRFGLSPLATSRPRLGGVPVTSRELAVARLVAESLTTAEIAKRLTISPYTVGHHLTNIYARLGITSRTALARCVMEAGLVQPRHEK
ncbi:MAG: LuxR C-terminal-related transcriptional regulator, partial [Dehalococcoidia bacterium]|nr:LuxR C-terminal-related transcriptional regulator [Dehalococcoidia bacterium]